MARYAARFLLATIAIAACRDEQSPLPSPDLPPAMVAPSAVAPAAVAPSPEASTSDASAAVMPGDATPPFTRRRLLIVASEAGIREVGFRSAFVRRPEEWGAVGPPDPVPDPSLDIVVDDFGQLADRLGC